MRKHPDTHVYKASDYHLYMALNGIAVEINMLEDMLLSLTLTTQSPSGRYHVFIDHDAVQEYTNMKAHGYGDLTKKAQKNLVAKFVEQNIICPILSEPTIEGMDTPWIDYCQWFVAHNVKHLVSFGHYGGNPIFSESYDDLAWDAFLPDWGFFHGEHKDFLKWIAINRLLDTANIDLKCYAMNAVDGDYNLELSLELTTVMDHLHIPKLRGNMIKLTSTVPQPNLIIEFDADSLWDFYNWDNVAFSRDSKVKIIMPATASFPYLDDPCFCTYRGIAELDYSHITKKKRRTYRQYNDTTESYGGTIVTLPPK